MTQLDPRSSTTATPSTPGTGGPSVKEGPPFNWRVSVGMAIGLVVLFGVLFGLRAFGIFPPRPAEDPEIVAVRATLAALPTQQPAPGAKPTLSPTQPPAPATLGAIVPATPAPTSAAPAVATVASVSTTQTQELSTAGARFETAPTPMGTTTPDQAVPIVAGTPTGSAPADATPATQANSRSVQPTPLVINLPANLANAILRGYQNYWTVRVNALNDPYDASINLESVMGGTELETARQTIAYFRDTGETGISNVHHQIWITSASPERAVVVDRYTAHGQRVMVDPTTHVPLPGDPSIEEESYADRFLLQNIDGVWKVVAEEPE